MAYQGKTNWTKDDIVKPDDMNRIEQGVKDAHDSIDNISQSLTPESIGAAKKSDFDAHVQDTTKHVTAAERNAWNGKETPDGAQQKASAAETNAKNYVNDLQWQRKKVSDDAGNANAVSDLNADLTTGWYMGSSMANAPTSEWYWVEIIRHNQSWTVQNAYCFNRQSYYQRMKINGNWTPWSQDLFQSGVNAKQGTVDALNSKSVAASTNDDWPALNGKIRTLHGRHDGSLTMKGSQGGGGNPGAGYQYVPITTVPAGATQIILNAISTDTWSGNCITIPMTDSYSIEIRLELVDITGKAVTIAETSGSSYGIGRVYFQSITYSPNSGELYFNAGYRSNGETSGFNFGRKDVGTLNNSGALSLRMAYFSPTQVFDYDLNMSLTTYL